MASFICVVLAVNEVTRVRHQVIKSPHSLPSGHITLLQHVFNMRPLRTTGLAFMDQLNEKTVKIIMFVRNHGLQFHVIKDRTTETICPALEVNYFRKQGF